MKPDGRTVQQFTDLPVDLKQAYDDMVASGCRLEAEVISADGSEVHVSIFDMQLDEDIDSDIIPNGPAVQDAIGGMLKRGLWKEAA